MIQLTQFRHTLWWGCCGTGSSELECLQWKPRGKAGCCQRLHFPPVSSSWLRVPAKNVVRLLLENIKYLHLEVKNKLFFFNAVFEGMKKGGIINEGQQQNLSQPTRVIIILFWLNLGDLNLIPIPSFLHLAQRDKIAKQVAPQLSVMSGMNFTPIYILDPSSYHYIDCLPVQIIVGWRSTRFSFF